MRLASREYFSRNTIGDASACDALWRRLMKALKPLLEQKKILGYTTTVFHTIDDVYEEELEAKMLMAETGHQFPFVWLNITFEKGASISDILQLEQEFELTFFGYAEE